jgi:hypothetical protein
MFLFFPVEDADYPLKVLPALVHRMSAWLPATASPDFQTITLDTGQLRLRF